jgi:peptidoglycan/LPS O-acetylase OafA/YrhL
MTGSQAVLDPLPPYRLPSSNSYIRSLDGLRGVAIAFVAVSHAGFGDIIPGAFGVTIFFFISGFLITRLLIAEHKENGAISISQFYQRRVLRLFPALVVVIVIETAIFYAQNGVVFWGEIISAFLYYYNYHVLFVGDNIKALGALWSLAVEEHFYFVFPFLFLRNVQTLGRFLAYVSAACIVVLLWRLLLVYEFDVLSVSPDYPYYATDCRIDSILFGVFLALGVENKFVSTKVLPLVMNWLWFATGLVMLLATFIFRSEEFRQTVRYTIQGLALIPLFTCALFGQQFGIIRAILELKPLVWIGKVSYSLYLWHMPVIFLVRYFFPHAGLFTSAALSLSSMLVVSAASYYFVEQPFVGLRRRLHRGPNSGRLARSTVSSSPVQPRPN